MAHYRRRRSTRYRRNPSRRGGGGGESNLGLYLLIGGGAYLLMSGSLSNLFGTGTAVPGYTSLGGNTYRNNATGQVVTRDPTTGNLVTSTGGVIPAGTPAWLAPTVMAGTAAIPQIGIGLAQGLVGALTGGVKALFSPSSTPTTPTASASAPSSVPQPEAPGPGYVAPSGLPDLPPLGSEIPVGDMPGTLGGGSLPELAPLPTDVMPADFSMNVVATAPTIDTSSGFDAGTWF